MGKSTDREVDAPNNGANNAVSGSVRNSNIRQYSIGGNAVIVTNEISIENPPFEPQSPKELPPFSKTIVDREKELEQLNELASSGRSGEVAILTGLPGIG
jgi:hypothetical protein